MMTDAHERAKRQVPVAGPPGATRKYKQNAARQGRRLPSFLSLRLEVSLLLGIWSLVLSPQLPK